jgi:hypothetical protein
MELPTSKKEALDRPIAKPPDWRIHLCEVNQFVAAPIDHSFKREHTKASGFVQVIVGGIERIAGSLTVSDLAFPASDNAADPQYVRC